MVKRTGPTNNVLRKLIVDLEILGRKKKVNLWKRISFDLNKPTRERREVNITTINRTIKKGEIALVPGKVLSDGELTNKVTVAAFRFSEKARDKINKNGKAISIQELIKENPEGKKVRIIG